MKISEIFEKTSNKCIICLGRFDGLHLGHLDLINKAKSLKENYFIDAEIAIFSILPKGENNAIFSSQETYYKAKNLGVDLVIYAEPKKEFFEISATDFLALLIENFNPICIICGEDYRFGFNRVGTIKTLNEFCEFNDILLEIVPIKKVNGEKISSTKIRSLLIDGKINLANELLGENYFVLGKVEKGRGLGKKLNFPTANVKISSEKVTLKHGVYETKTKIDNKVYKSVSNFGAAKTFGCEKILLETHILGFSGNIYGKEIVVEFVRFLRENIKFSSKEELCEQVKKDVESVL